MKYIILEKAQVKPYTRTKKGKMERVGGYSREQRLAHNQKIREANKERLSALEGKPNLLVQYYEKRAKEDKPPERTIVRPEEGAKEVANTILSQMGGIGRIKAMTGAKNFMYFDEKGRKGVSFDFPNKKGPNFVKITLEPNDTYSVEFGKKKAISWKKRERDAESGLAPNMEDFYKKHSEHSDIYFDQLKPLFEQTTGLYLSLGKSMEMHTVDDMNKSRTSGAKDKKPRKKPGHFKHWNPVTNKEEWIPYKAKNVIKVEQKIIGWPAKQTAMGKRDYLD